MTTHPLVRFRTATLADAPILRDTAVAAYSEYAGVLDPEHWSTMAASLNDEQAAVRLMQQATCFICEYDGALAGIAYLIPSGHPTAHFQAGWSYIRLLGVLPAYRGKHIGRLLTSHCIEQARQSGERVIALHTSEFQHAARHIYEDLGFTVHQEIGPIYGKRYWVYTLPL